MIPPSGPQHGPHIVVIGNHKGGTGKSTVAMHVIVALLRSGRSVATFDLDLEQQTLTRYIDNRREWARQNARTLELPRHLAIVEPDWSAADDGEAGVVARFIRLLSEVQDHDVIVIDTPAGPHHLSLLAHGMADTLVTPINDSFVDLDVIVTIGPTGGDVPRPSRYAKAVAAALEGRRKVCGRPSDWIVVRNRVPQAPSRQRPQIADALDLIAPQVGFRVVPGLSERVVFRQLFPHGLTAVDQLDHPILGLEPQISHLMARVEVRELVEGLGLVAPRAVVGEEDGVSGARAELLPADLNLVV